MTAREKEALIENAIRESNFYIINDKYKEYVNDLLKMRDKVSNINKNQFLRCIKGMSMEKYKALEHPYPTLIEKINKYGYDPKQLHHILRLNEFIERYVSGESLNECYISNIKDELIRVKKGFYNLEQACILAKTYDIRNKEICDSHITKVDNIDYEAIDELNLIVTKILKYYFYKDEWN